MEENRAHKSNDFKDISDDEERGFFQLHSIGDKTIINPQKFATQLRELKLLQIILYSLIISGIIALFILILNGIHFIIIATDIGLVIIYTFYVKYLEQKYRRTSKTLGGIIGEKKKEKFTKLKMFFSLMMIILTMSILILLIIGIDPLTLIITFLMSLVYIYFDIEDNHSPDI